MPHRLSSRPSSLVQTLECLLVDTHLWVSAAAACLTLFVATAIAAPVRLESTGIVFSATLLIYAIDDVFDGRMSRQPLRWLTVAVAAVALGFQLLRAPALTTLLVGLGALPALAYGVPICGRRLRELPGIKPFFVALSLAVAVSAVPTLLAWERGVGGAHLTQVLPVGGLLFLLILSNVCFFDLRDLQDDARKGIRTIPVQYGAAGTRAVCVLLSLLVCLSVILSSGLLDVFLGRCLLLSAAASTLYALCLPVTGNRLSYALMVDGVPILLGVSVLLRPMVE